MLYGDSILGMILVSTAFYLQRSVGTYSVQIDIEQQTSATASQLSPTHSGTGLPRLDKQPWEGWVIHQQANEQCHEAHLVDTDDNRPEDERTGKVMHLSTTSPENLNA